MGTTPSRGPATRSTARDALLLALAVAAVAALVLRRRSRAAEPAGPPATQGQPSLPDPWADAPRDQRSPRGDPPPAGDAAEAGPRPAVLPGRPRLVAVAGGTLPHGSSTLPPEVELRAGRQVVGRDRETDIRLPHASVSPRHVALDAGEDGTVRLHDLGSLNGTLVDGVPRATAALTDGNRITLGEAQLVFHSDPETDDGGRQGGELGEHGVGDGRGM